MPEDESGLVTLVPQRADLSDEFSDHVARQSRDPTIADEHCKGRVVRSEEKTKKGSKRGVACVIDQYKFVRKK